MDNNGNNLPNITLVITSCGRLDLLNDTIVSLFKYYFFPKERFIIIDDSGKQAVFDELTKLYDSSATLIFNHKNLGLLKSIDKAYSNVSTPYIFHCEDDWEFYRPNFIEESIKMLEAESKLKQVNLRSIYHDYIINHPLAIDAKRLNIAGMFCYQVKLPKLVDKSNIITTFPLEELDWSCASFNPGIIRKSDYELAGSYSSVANSEAEISSWYKKKGFYMVVLENDAVLHTGWGYSLEGHDPETYNFKKRLRNFLKSGLNLLGANWTYEKG